MTLNLAEVASAAGRQARAPLQWRVAQPVDADPPAFSGEPGAPPGTPSAGGSQCRAPSFLSQRCPFTQAELISPSSVSKPTGSFSYVLIIQASLHAVGA